MPGFVHFWTLKYQKGQKRKPLLTFLSLSLTLSSREKIFTFLCSKFVLGQLQKSLCLDLDKNPSKMYEVRGLRSKGCPSTNSETRMTEDKQAASGLHSPLTKKISLAVKSETEKLSCYKHSDSHWFLGFLPYERNSAPIFLLYMFILRNFVIIIKSLLMRFFSKLPTSNISDLTLQLKIKGQNIDNVEIRSSFFPAEWFPQSGVQLTWPHAGTDWKDMLDEVTQCYIQIAYEISTEEKLLIVAPDIEDVKTLLSQKLPQKVLNNIIYCQCPTNDTWARDHGFITVFAENKPELLDFHFNGWGEKFPAGLDNAINKNVYDNGILRGEYVDCLDFVLEGGAIESDGRGTLLTTLDCLLHPKRNPCLSQADIEERLKRQLHCHRILWLRHGHLIGDDTDGHIDTLARFCPNNTIIYTQCSDKLDEHFEELNLMEHEIQDLRTTHDEPYTLIALPLPDPIVHNGERLPATYANFLIMNNKVLVPAYNQPHNDEMAIKRIQEAFPKHEIKGINCLPLIKQHGSLHCITMQFPANIIK